MHEKRMEIRWSDVDSYDHVNNAVYFTYLEEVRDEWLEKTFAGIEGPIDWVLARVAIDFRQELTLEDEEVVAKCSLVKIGNKSITTREEIWSAKGFLSAESESVMVAHDPEKRESREMTDAERAGLERGREPA
ncbi:MAG: thioesterase family protein [Actinomycetota bacterium]